MLPANLTPRRVLWLVSFCLLALPAFAHAAPAKPADTSRIHHALHRVHAIAHAFALHPVHKTVDDNNDDESDDLIGDSWLAPCAMPLGEAFQSLIRVLPAGGPPRSSPVVRSFTATDPFAPRPPPVRS